MCLHVGLYTRVQVSVEAGVIASLGAGVTEGCELSDMGARNLTYVKQELSTAEPSPQPLRVCIFLKQGFSLNLELEDSARQAGQWTPGTLLFLSYKHWDYRSRPLCLTVFLFS